MKDLKITTKISVGDTHIAEVDGLITSLGKTYDRDSGTVTITGRTTDGLKVLAKVGAELFDAPGERWRADAGERYWYVDDELDMECDYEGKTPTDDKRHKINNYFRTESEAEKAADWLKAFATLKADAKGHKFHMDEPNVKVIYDPNHDADDDGFAFEYNYCFSTSPLYFKTKEDAIASIKAHPKEWLTYLGVEE